MAAMTTTNGAANDGAIIERVIALGDLEQLKPIERASYYARLCESLGLNPLTQPFMYVRLNGKLQLYARKDATDQMRNNRAVSIRIVARELDADGVYTVTARARMPDGREDESTGCVHVGSKKGEDLANAKMKAETKAKRRVTLSICGLGWLDETEVQDVRSAKPVQVTQDGEIVEQDLTKQLAASVEHHSWPKWTQACMSALREASKHGVGALQEMWSEVYTEMQKLNPPDDARTMVTECKEELKASLKGGK